MSDREFESLEEANQFIARITERRNFVAQIDFLGLSSSLLSGFMTGSDPRRRPYS